MRISQPLCATATSSTRASSDAAESPLAVAIEYAGVTVWRHHAAFQERGWESYIAVNCGLEQGEDLVVSFFDSVPRGTTFTRSERALVEQLAPWIASMVGGIDSEWECSEAGKGTELTMN